MAMVVAIMVQRLRRMTRRKWRKSKSLDSRCLETVSCNFYPQLLIEEASKADILLGSAVWLGAPREPATGRRIRRRCGGVPAADVDIIPLCKEAHLPIVMARMQKLPA